MNTESIDLRRVKVPIPHDVEVMPGDFAWDFDSEETGGSRKSESAHIYICLPCDRHMSCIKIVRGNSNAERVWGWDGNEDKPTLTPSILLPGQWHGWLRAGRLCSC